MILYTIDCPKCQILEEKLDAKNFDYIKEKDVDKMLSLGITTAPVLLYDGKLYNFMEACKLLESLPAED